MSRHTLLMRLEGPMQSWATQSPFNRYRDSGREPSKSGIFGLICNALGKVRQEEAPENQGLPSLSQLRALRIGVRVDREGEVQRDFQTIGGGNFLDTDKYGVYRSSGIVSPNPIVSDRFYIADASYLVGLESDDLALLEQIEEALASPARPLYLGRKAFVPSAPVHIQDGIEQEPLEDALASYDWYARTVRERNRMKTKVAQGQQDGVPVLLRMVTDAPFGSTPEVRIDVPVDFAERKFVLRYVTVDMVELTPAMIKLAYQDHQEDEEDVVDVPVALDAGPA